MSDSKSTHRLTVRSEIPKALASCLCHRSP